MSTTASPLVVTAAIILQPLLWLGFGRRYPWAALGLERVGPWFWGVVTLAYFMALAVVARRATARDDVRRPGERASLLLLLACPPLTLAIDFAAAYHFAHFGYRTPWIMIGVETVILVALVRWIMLGRPLGYGAAIAGVGAAAHRALAIQLFPDDPRRSDMLSLIRGGIDLAAAGGSPYAPQLSAATGEMISLQYLPGTWLVHWPSVAVGADMRWLGTILLLALAIWVAVHVRSRSAELLAVLLFLSPYHAFRHELYFEAFLLLSFMLFFLAARPQPVAARVLCGIAVLAGLAIVTRQWAWIYVPFVLMAAAIGTGDRVRLVGRFALALLVAAGTAFLVALPWVMRDPALFYLTVLRPFAVKTTELCFGLSGLLLQMGLGWLLHPAQAAVCILAFGAAAWHVWKRRMGAETVAVVGWITWLVVISLNPFLENYFYLSVSFAALGLGVANSADGSSRRLEAPRIIGTWSGADSGRLEVSRSVTVTRAPGGVFG